MSDPHDGKQFPVGVLYAAAALIALTLILTLVGRLTGLGTVGVPEAAVAHQVEVQFIDEGAEGLVMASVSTGLPLARVAPGDDGFVRGVLRGMNRTRMLERIDQSKPFLLTEWADGRITLLDESTNRQIDLLGFGATNFEAFARLVAASRAPETTEGRP